MNIAFPAVLIFLLVLPGVVFKRWLSISGRFGNQHPLADEFFPAMGAAAISHFVWICGCYLLSPLTGLVVDLKATLLLAAGQIGTKVGCADPIDAVSLHPIAVFLYFSTLLLACGFSGRIIRYCRTKKHGEARAVALFAEKDEIQARRFAEWAQILLMKTADSEAAYIIVASLTIGTKSYLYAGLLKHVFWNDLTGEPEWLQICSTIRRDVTDDRDDKLGDDKLGDDKLGDDHRWYEVVGDSFMLRFSKVDTLNLVSTELQEEIGPSEAKQPTEAENESPPTS